MEDEEKIKSLEKEIGELKVKDEENDKVHKLLDERNRLKFKHIFAIGGMLKRIGQKLAEWADIKNAQIKEDKKSKKNKEIEEESVDLYKELFGEDPMFKKMEF